MGREGQGGWDFVHCFIVHFSLFIASMLIVIGSSLGGLRALQTVLSPLPSSFAAPILIAQHRDANAESSLAELLQNNSALKVVEAEDKMPIQNGWVYLAPPNYHLLVEGSQCALSTEAEVNHARPSIDVLFESAADECGKNVMGVILSGANADGAKGLAAIARAGGVSVVQDPATAEAAIMPQAAIALTAVDRILKLEEIAEFLIAKCK